MLNQSKEIDVLFAGLQQECSAQPYLPIHERRHNLQILKRILQVHANELADAVNQDFSHRAYYETVFMEIFPAIKAINYCLSHLKKWTKTRKRSVSWLFKPAKAYVFPQPLGIIGIMVPWNYPIYLAIVPLAYALAAGNRVMINMSELTPEIAKKLDLLIKSSTLKDNLVHIVQGGVDEAKHFASLAFGHLLFTGSTEVGKQVMRAASNNLTPVTLELGGKSPVIFSASANLSYIKRLLMGKLVNAGQTCIAPDYLLLHKSWEHQLEVSCNLFLTTHYPDLLSNSNYSSIISPQHLERLNALLEDAQQKGARIVPLVERRTMDRKMPFFLIFDVNLSMRVMQEEIFGPLLPVLLYDEFNQAVDIIRSRPAPLVIYYFGEEVEEKRLLQKETRSGALTINDTLTQIAVDDLPFGGLGLSGFGHYHGQEGFDNFSKLKPIFAQRRFAPVTWFYPPYGRLMRFFLNRVAGISVGD